MYTNLKFLMQQKNMSARDLAELLGVSEKTIKNKLAGVTEFLWSEIKKICSIWPEYNINWIFARQEEPKSA